MDRFRLSSHTSYLRYKSKSLNFLGGAAAAASSSVASAKYTKVPLKFAAATTKSSRTMLTPTNRRCAPSSHAVVAGSVWDNLVNRALPHPPLAAAAAAYNGSSSKK